MATKAETPKYVPGDEAEIFYLAREGEDENLKAWFRCRITKVYESRTHYDVEYLDLVQDDLKTPEVERNVPVTRLRPMLGDLDDSTTVAPWQRRVGDAVEMYEYRNTGWWEGTVTAVRARSCDVYFEFNGELAAKITVNDPKKRRLRTGWRWKNDSWTWEARGEYLSVFDPEKNPEADKEPNRPGAR